jgi:hypothetical protein
MAPASAPEAASTPLADFFWIAGVDGSEILEIFSKLGEEYRANHVQTPTMSDTIEEDADAEEEHLPPSERYSFQRLSKIEHDARQSIRSLASDLSFSESNRSSLTIKPSQSSSSASLLSDLDFDKALLKFAAERDSFLLDLSLNAGMGVQNRPKARTRTQKIVSPEEGNPLKSGIGSVRRHMSFREMNSMKRQPSLARHGESIRSPTQSYKLSANLRFPLTGVLQPPFVRRGA